MINELSRLAEAIEQADIKTQSWYRTYGPIPKIRENAPCIRILINDGEVVGISAVNEKIGAGLRKYGTNQGSYPCMNLAPLYKITDSDIKNKLSAVRPEELDTKMIEDIKGWCRNNNWEGKFKNKYKISMVNTTEELTALVPGFEPIQILIGESKRLADIKVFHQKLEDEVFRMLKAKENVSLALKILFYHGTDGKIDDYGMISAALDTPKLIDMGIPAISNKFALAFNEALISADRSGQGDADACGIDAFGIPFNPIEKPMPKVKLAGGFPVIIRTMFRGQPCQTRYNRIENESYPISGQMRDKLKDALGWIGSAERKNITWINTDVKEILFAYPASFADNNISYTQMFGRPIRNEATFEEKSGQFISELFKRKKPGTDSRADGIQLFILRKIDNGRTKIVYTRQTDPHELEKCSEAWTKGCRNLPVMTVGQPRVPFPLDTADILNRFWKQNGELATDKLKPAPKHHGIELLLECDAAVNADMYCMSEKAMTVGAFVGNGLAKNDIDHNVLWKIKDMLALMGLLLYREGIRKDDYMESLAYLYGQLFKASDELHALYCRVVRNGELPAQLAGAGVFQAAAEAPVRTLHVLQQRMNPYISWAKTYRTKNIVGEEREISRAGVLLWRIESIATRLYKEWRPVEKFSDEEKAILFIGYLAAFPKKSQNANDKDAIDRTDETKEDKEQWITR